MREDVREAIGEALGKVDRPGSFCASGSAPAMLPGLEVDGVGPVGLPLTAGQAKDLIKHARQAPFGKGEATVVDPSVRRVWRIEPGRFSLANAEWDRFLKARVGEVQAELGLEGQKLEAHLHDLLIYERGGFFLPHRDGEKLDRMVATLVVVLPSAHEGGELVIRHDGQERTVDLGGLGGDPFRIQYAAFYADCEHEIRPIRKGHRLCLVYNLTLAKSRKVLTAPRISGHVERIRRLLGRWAEDDSGGKLVAMLDHQYTKDGLAWDALKGVDRVKAQVLREAARLEGCRAYLALLTLWELGEAEEMWGGSGSRRRRRWGDVDDGSGDGPHEMMEVYEKSLRAEHLIDGDGNPLPIGTLNVEEGELLDPESLKGIDPEEFFHGYTGNEGATLERWYRHAALVVWPERRHFAILCDRDGRDLVPVLEPMVASWRQASGEEAEGLKAQCVALADAILARWNAQPSVRDLFKEPSNGGDLLGSLVAIGDPGLINRFLGDVMARDASVDPGGSLVAACQELGWEALRPGLLALMEQTTAVTRERNVRLFERVCTARGRKKAGWGELVPALARAIVQAVESIDRQPPRDDWGLRKVDRAEVLGGLARSLVAAGQPDLLARVVAHALASPGRYPLRSVLVPSLVALRPWLAKHRKGLPEAIARWVASCREQLESLTARAPEAPADFRREARIDCKCEDCAELRRFLEDPAESVHRFRMRQDRRRHLEDAIRHHECDLDRRTDTSGSPQTLVCTKNQASYRRRLQTYQEDQERLAAVRSIEASLSG